MPTFTSCQAVPNEMLERVVQAHELKNLPPEQQNKLALALKILLLRRWMSTALDYLDEQDAVKLTAKLGEDTKPADLFNYLGSLLASHPDAENILLDEAEHLLHELTA